MGFHFLNMANVTGIMDFQQWLGIPSYKEGSVFNALIKTPCKSDVGMQKYAEVLIAISKDE